jgi:hypothetical protein
LAEVFTEHLFIKISRADRTSALALVCDRDSGTPSLAHAVIRLAIHTADGLEDRWAFTHDALTALTPQANGTVDVRQALRIRAITLGRYDTPFGQYRVNACADIAAD